MIKAKNPAEHKAANIQKQHTCDMLCYIGVCSHYVNGTVEDRVHLSNTGNGRGRAYPTVPLDND